MDDSQLISRAQGIARCLSYNDQSQAAAKHVIRELCHRLGAKVVRVHKKKDGWLMITCFGQSRFLTWRESVLYRLFKVVPNIDVNRKEQHHE